MISRVNILSYECHKGTAKTNQKGGGGGRHRATAEQPYGEQFNFFDFYLLFINLIDHLFPRK